MKTLLGMVVGAVLVSTTTVAGKDKPVIEKENLTKLQSLKTIFVDGNNESSDKVRQHLESWTCLALSNNRTNADAVMEVQEREKPSDIHEVSTSATITMPNGDLIWSRTKTGAGFVHSGAGEAVEKLLHDLAKDACPGKHYRRHMG